jgi:hypothetical protein
MKGEFRGRGKDNLHIISARFDETPLAAKSGQGQLAQFFSYIWTELHIVPPICMKIIEQ